MRFLPIAALFLTCSAATVAAESPLESNERRCARILPTLTADSGQQQDKAARPDEPLLYKAVEHRVAGCSVLIMHQTGELRAVPEIDKRRSLFVPAR